MRASVIIVIALISFAAGFGASALYHTPISDAEGERLNCVDHGSVCVGMDARHALLKASAGFGRLWSVMCDFKRPGANVRDEMMLDEIIAHGCTANNYMALFKNEKYMTMISIENGKVVRLDRTSAYDKGL